MGEIVELTKEEKAQIREDRRLANIKTEADKMYTSYMLARRQNHVYLFADEPNVMYTSQVSPDRLMHHCRNVDESMHRIVAGADVDLMAVWKRKYPCLGDRTNICISCKGVDRWIQTNKGDPDKMAADLKEYDGVGFTIAIDKNGKQEDKPVYYDIDEDYRIVLEEHFEAYELFKDTAVQVDTMLLTTEHVYGSLSYVPLPETIAPHVRVPYIEGFTGPAIKSYCGRVKIPGVTMELAKNAKGVVRMKCTTECTVATTTSITPAWAWINIGN